MVGDKISNLIISLKNASLAGKDKVSVMNTKLNKNILQVLADGKFIASFDSKGKDKNISVELGYDEAGNASITDVKRISKLSKRVYTPAVELRSVKNGLGLAVVSTSAGVMSNNEARAKKVGGEVMFEIW